MESRELLKIYRRVDETTDNYPRSKPTTQEVWHCHVEGVPMVALNRMNLPIEVMAKCKTSQGYFKLSSYLDVVPSQNEPCFEYRRSWINDSFAITPSPDAGPSVNQATSELQNWKCAGCQADGWCRWWETTNSESTSPTLSRY